MTEIVARVDKMVITYSRVKSRPKPREGDRKTVKGKEYVRKQSRERGTGAGYVQNGRPVFEWVPV